MGTTLASVVLLLFMLSGGYYVQVRISYKLMILKLLVFHFYSLPISQDIPAWISWIRYIAFTYYSYNLNVKIQYNNKMTYNCGPPNAISSVKCPLEDALRGISLKNGWVDALALVGMIVLYRSLAYISLRRMKTV